MKAHFINFKAIFALTVSAMLSIFSQSFAATLYWDGTSTTVNADGGVGNWNNSLTNWDTLAAGGADTAWTAGDTAVFTNAALASIVTLTDNITVGGLTFNSRNNLSGSSYTLNTNGNTLSFASGDNAFLFTPSNGATSAIITGQVAGTGANVILRSANSVYPSTVTFNGTSTGGWTGTTTINPGMTMSLAASSQALLNTTGITLNGGNILLTNTTTGSENTIDRVSDTAAITSYGSGSISIANTSAAGRQYSETIGSITHSNGQLSLGFTTVQNGTAPSTQTLMVGGLTRSGTATIAINGGGSGAGSLHGNSFFKVNGITTSTAANEIIGPWMTAGSVLAAQSDWAVYQSDGVSGRVVSRNIAASAQTTWTSSSATGNYTAAMGIPTAVTTNNRLTADRFVNTLRTTFSESAAATHTMTAATDTIAFAGHALTDGDVVGFRAAGGLTDSRPYYVINSVAGTSFQLSLTPGGPLLDLTSDTEGFITTGLNLNGKTLGTSGFITGTTGAAAIGGGSASTITLPTTTSGNLYLHGAASIWIDSPIKDNGAGVLTLVKSGTTAVTLSGNNTFTGGLVVNAGTLRLSGDQSFTGGVTLSGGAFGDTIDGITGTEINSNSLTVNGYANMFITSGSTIAGAVDINSMGNLVLNGDTATFSGVVSGSGALTTFSRANTTVTLANTANTHTGVIVLSNDNNTNITLAVNSLADSLSPGAGNILMGGGAAIGGPTFALHSGAVAPLILNNRQFDLLGDVTNLTNKLSNNSVQAFTIGSNLLASGTGIKTLTLGGTGIGLSTFGGTVTNGSLTTLNLTKADANNTWSLTNAASSYNGVTTVSAGTLQFSSIANAGTNSSLGNFATAGATGISLGGGTLQYTGASGVSVNRGFTLAANSAIDVNPVNTALTLGNSSLGAFTLSVTGGTGSSLGLGALTLTGAATLNPTTANLTVASVTATNLGLTLGGTSSGNTVTGAINTGTGTLTKNTSSTWTLSGANGYTGATTVSAGLLRVNGSLNAGSAVGVSAGALGGTGTVGGAVTVSGTGGINLSNGSVGTLTLSSTLASTGAAAANNFTFDLASDGSTVDKIAASGAFSMTTSGAVVVNPNQLGGSASRLTAGTYDLMTAASGLTAGGGQFQLATTKAFGQTFSLASTTTTALKLTTTQVSGAVLANTTLSGANPSWQTAGNFTGAAIPDYQSNVIINSNIGTTGALNASVNINSLTYGTSATTGTTIAAGTAAAGVASNMLVIEAAAVNGNTAGNGITLSNASGTHTISANVGLAASQIWTVGSGAGLTMSGIISDFGGGYGLTKEGGGTLTLSGVNTFNGPLTIANGTVFAASADAAKGANGLYGAGTTLVMGSNGQTGRLAVLQDGFPSFAKDITLATGGTGEFQFGNLNNPTTFNITNTDRTLTLSGNVSGSGNFTKLGGATIILSGNNTFTGTTTINEGALRLSSATALPGGIGATGGTGGLTINGNAASGNVGAVVSLTAASGDFRRSLGTGVDQFQITGGVSGFEANGSARQVVVGNDAALELQWGIPTFNPSALLLGYNQVTATGTLTLQNKIDLNAATRTVQVNTGAATSTISGDIRTSSGTAGLTKTGGGTLALSGSNTYNGTTTVSAGTLQLGSGGTTGTLNTSSLISVGSGAAFAVNQSDTVTQGIEFSGAAISGLGGFTQAGPGTTILNFANTYIGQTTVSAGTLQLNDGGVISAAPLFLNGGTFALNRSATATLGSTFSAIVSGTGSLANMSASTLVLNAPTFHTGNTTATAGNITLSHANAIQNSALNTTGNGTVTLSGVTTPTFGGLANSGTARNLASVIDSSYANVTSLTLNPQSGITFTYGGVIANGATDMTLTKTGAGTQVLQGANNYSGATSIKNGTLTLSGASGAIASSAINLNGGGLTLDNTTNSEARISDSAAIAVNGRSTLTFSHAGATGVNYTETIDTLSLQSGFLTYTGSQANVTGPRTSNLQFNTLSRTGASNTSTVNFTGTGLGTDGRNTIKFGAGVTNGVDLGPWAVVNGADFASYSTANGIVAATFTTLASGSNNSANNFRQSTNIASLGLSLNPSYKTLQIFDATTNVRSLGLNGNTVSVGGISATGGSAVGHTVSGTGAVQALNAGDALYVHVNNFNLNVSSTIQNVGAGLTASALVKSGVGTLTLGGTNTYTGGTVLNSGTLSFDSALNIGGINNTGGSTASITVNGNSTIGSVTNNIITNLGTGAITINNGATLTVTSASRGDLRFGGAVTGSGGITATSGSFWAKYSFTNTANTFTGAITDSRGGNDGVANALFSFNSIADGAGYGNIMLSGANDSGIDYGSGAIAPLTLNNRQIVLANSNTVFFNNASAQAVNINTDIGFSGTGARQMRFGISGRSGVGISTFAGKLTDNAGGAFTPTFNGGTWSLTNANTHTGTTTVSAGVLILGNALALQNSVLDTANSVAGAAATGLRTTQTALTIGGLSGSKNFASTGGVFSTTSGGYGSVTDLTLNPFSNVSYAGVIANGAANMNVTKTGVGAQILTNTQTYTGATNVNNGILTLGHATNTLANTGVVNVNGGTLDLGANSDTVGSVTLASGSITGTGTLTAATYGLTGGTLAAKLGAGAVTVNGNVTFSAAGRLNASSSLLIQGGTLTLSGDENVDSFQQTGGTLAGGFSVNSASNYDLQSGTLSGDLGGSSGLNKTGEGTTILSGTNTYTGATNVNSGKLVVNGNISSSSLTSVASGATIGGSGTVGELTVSSGGFINPGNSPGILNVSGDYTQAGLYTAEITGLTAGTEHDQINVTGSVDITGGSLTALFTAGTYAANDLIFILLNDGVDAITGTYSGFAQGATVIEYDGFDWKISYTANSTTNSFTGGNDIALMAIPEPKAALLGGIGLLLLLRRRR